ncbi:tubulin epsilon and delta complex protein 1 isoform X3 [Saimiri boliviensis]|uniref:tubulin epsilon and delta complex protein 1 isoform X3 n=1 Tax=Saimiri boliviensis TaxID=27679 RepID=UPI00193CBA70|nr:tubulin epsilon and delta complex protein 1 isoform X2 [Saimiri boliviensis boliviensis]
MLVRRSRAAAAGYPKEAGAGSMGRRRRRVHPAAGARAGALPEAIAALSRSLPSGPSPEIFRRAKFDRPEATPALWQLLFRVLAPLPLDNPLASLAPEVQARLVKSALRSQGYPRLALAQLPEDGSQGSRELLLALSWLLARGPVPEQMLAQTRVPLGDEMTVCQCEALASPGPPAPQVRAEDPVDVRYVQWLMGKLRFRWRQLVSSQQEQCTLLSKLLRTLEYENRRLEAVLTWRRTELVFWQWMDTVLDTCAPRAPAAASQGTFLPGIPEHRGGELELVAWELRALQEELQEAAECRRAAWEAKAGGCGRGPEWSAVRRASREAVEKELGALQRCWEQDRDPAQPHGPHRLVRREDGAAGDWDLRAAEVIRTLRSQEACLEAVLHQLQGQCRQGLARLAGALPGLIWIPPLGR